MAGPHTLHKSTAQTPTAHRDKGRLQVSTQVVFRLGCKVHEDMSATTTTVVLPTKRETTGITGESIHSKDPSPQWVRTSRKGPHRAAGCQTYHQ
jgi:hypothetical protein